jgi:hypothetical protein
LSPAANRAREAVTTEEEVPVPPRPSDGAHLDSPPASPPQGHASWPYTTSTLERAAAWLAARPRLSAKARRLRIRLASSASRIVGLLLGLLGTAGLAGVGLAAARREPLPWDDVLATGVVLAMWAGNRALRARWEATGRYELRTRRSWFPKLLPWRPAAAPARRPSRVARLRRK